MSAVHANSVRDEEPYHNSHQGFRTEPLALRENHKTEKFTN